ncbi:unnamed protein product [Dibothriocephalus latus]|uniref:Pan3 C-terminal knob domain-containing protein n=1 Tax=Dibothriocephalus latus TaxID=60516 RepID=A0A3P7L5L2_DIBLA|nr:unnamed protein product [Dibothriocephalus latus]
MINCFGLRDIVTHNPAVDIVAQEKLADFVSLGKLMLGVIYGTASAIQRPNAIQLISQVYKKELANLISDLLSGTVTSVDTLTMVTAPYAYDHLASLYSSNDFLEQQLLREMECERLFRLICKLNSVVERNDVKRPDRSAPAWSETGDRYMLKLFRDFVFHQVDQCGAAHLDLAHIVNSLNKVECASPEKLCLVSRDGQRVIIASFAEVRQWLDNSFATLVEEHRRSLFEQQMDQQRQLDQSVAAAGEAVDGTTASPLEAAISMTVNSTSAGVAKDSQEAA